MNALQLYLLGRRLTKMGERAIRGSKKETMQASTLLILQDVFLHKNTLIKDITKRTGLPQSYVSASVAQLRAAGHLQTTSDPSDRRCTMVMVSQAFSHRVADRGMTSTDAVIADALGDEVGDASPQEVAEVVAELESLCRRLLGHRGDRPDGDGPRRVRRVTGRPSE